MQCDRSQQRKKRKREKDTGRDFTGEKPRSISNQDNCHVPGAGFSLSSLALWPHIQIQALKKPPFSLKDLLCLNLGNSSE